MKAVLYGRVSTSDQSDRGYSLPTQIEACQEYAERAGLEVLEIITESASALSMVDRPGLERARLLLASGKAGAIVAHDPDRVSRNPAEYALLRDEFDMAGVELHYATSGRVDLSDVGSQISQDVRARIAREEIRNMIERTQRGKRGAVAAGAVFTGNRPPFGYANVDGQLAIDPEEAETVRLIFDLYVDERLPIKQVAERLTQLKKPTRGDTGDIPKERGFGVWAAGTVGRILQNETYCGVWHYRKNRRQTIVVNGKKVSRRWKAPRSEWLAVDVPAIVTRQRWEAAQQRRADNTAYSRRNQRHRYLMARRLACAACGAVMYTTTAIVSGSKRLYYRCGSNHADTVAAPCGQPSIRADLVDTAAWEWLNGLIERRQLKAFTAAGIANMLADIADNGQRAAKIRAKIERKQDALARLLKMAVEGEIERVSFEQARTELREELAGLEAEIAALDDVDGQLSALERLTALADDFDAYSDRIGLNTPFTERLEWVERLNLRGVVDAAASQTEFSCDLVQIEVDDVASVLTSAAETHRAEEGSRLAGVIAALEALTIAARPAASQGFIWMVRQRVTLRKTADLCA